MLPFGMLWGSYCLFVLCLPPNKDAWHTTWTNNSHVSDKLVKDFTPWQVRRRQGLKDAPPVHRATSSLSDISTTTLSSKSSSIPIGSSPYWKSSQVALVVKNPPAIAG